MIKLKRKARICLLFLFFIASFRDIYATDVSIADKAAEAYLYGEYNRGDNYIGGFSLSGEYKLNSLFSARGGVFFGRAAEAMDLRGFTTADFSFFKKIPLNFSLSWKYSGLFLFNAHSNSILPVIKYGTDKAGASIGINFRFTSFSGDKPVIERVLAYLFYLNFINTEILSFGISAGNYDDFYAKNAAAFTINFNALVRIDKNWTVINKVEIMQSGIDGLAVNFYGFSWKGGAKFSW